MAENHRMTADELIGKLMDDEHRDVVRDSVAWLCRELMEAEVSAQVGAARGEPSLERTPRHTRAHERRLRLE